MILYEYPFNEGIRTMLRLERLFDRLGQLMARDSPLDHHFALATIFEIMDVASRADLKSDLLKELDRQRTTMQSYRGNPAVEAGVLEGVIKRLDDAWSRLNDLPGKAGAELATNEWLMSLRSRISIPGGTCEFDLPAYYAWEHRDPASRRADLTRWTATLMPFGEALTVLLSMIRESGVPTQVMATHGQYQQGLPSGRTFQLMRVRLAVADGIVPEITGHRLMVSIRLMQQEDNGRLKPTSVDLPLELTLCA